MRRSATFVAVAVVSTPILGGASVDARRGLAFVEPSARHGPTRRAEPVNQLTVGQVVGWLDAPPAAEYQ
jgi:hypothetical protein